MEFTMKNFRISKDAELKKSTKGGNDVIRLFGSECLRVFSKTENKYVNKYSNFNLALIVKNGDKLAALLVKGYNIHSIKGHVNVSEVEKDGKKVSYNNFIVDDYQLAGVDVVREAEEAPVAEAADSDFPEA